MNENPYQPPTQAIPDPVPNDRRQAIRAFHVSVAVLFIPAVYNVVCFNFALAMNQTQIQLSTQDRVLNLVGFALLMTFLWFFGLPLLEKAVRILHHLFATYSTLGEWNQTLFATLHRTPTFAMLGSLLWVIWIVAYYQLGLNFFLVSLPIGVASHLLAAFLYVPLIFGWYRAERDAKKA